MSAEEQHELEIRNSINLMTQDDKEVDDILSSNDDSASIATQPPPPVSSPPLQAEKKVRKSKSKKAEPVHVKIQPLSEEDLDDKSVMFYRKLLQRRYNGSDKLEEVKAEKAVPVAQPEEIKQRKKYGGPTFVTAARSCGFVKIPKKLMDDGVSINPDYAKASEKFSQLKSQYVQSSTA